MTNDDDRPFPEHIRPCPRTVVSHFGEMPTDADWRIIQRHRVRLMQRDMEAIRAYRFAQRRDAAIANALARARDRGIKPSAQPLAVYLEASQ